MILIADSGSTKTEWLFSEGNNVNKAFTQGMNPLLTSSAGMTKIIKEELPENFKRNCSQLFFYGAGCSPGAEQKKIKSVLKKNFPKAEISIDTDLLGAARACCGSERGMVAIIGTGSSVCYYNGKKIETVRPSLGYILGDEGSGNHIGKKIINDYFTGKMPPDLHEKFVKHYGITREKVIDAIYKSNYPNRFLASFATFAADNIQTIYCRTLVKNSFLELFENHIVPLHQKVMSTISFNGSIAVTFQEILLEICRAKQIEVNKIIKSPGEKLLEFHSK